MNDALVLVPWIPLLGAVVCLALVAKRSLQPLAGWVCLASVVASFLIVAPNVLSHGIATGESPTLKGFTVTAFDWITVNRFSVGFSYWIDGLTLLMLSVVTGIGSLIVLYAVGYMKGDRGYARFFAGVALFIFAMTSMVMADNLVLLYLGWEMVGLASFLLIGHYYDKPSAVAAAKKAFIVNRVADVGFALGIFTVYHAFGSVKYVDFLPAALAMLGQTDAATLAPGAARALASAQQAPQLALLAAPFLLLTGALGKSAQIPFHVWLPDAMEGPSPVSALIHAATMVTSGVYMIDRLLPLFELSPYALPTVAIIGGTTAIFAASIAITQHDLKRVFAFSTVSQLGYMMLGVGVLTTTGAMFHLVSHAFFKALLFLTVGSTMHALAGQLDMRKMSGLRHKLPVTCWLMFAGCLSLASFPLTAGFFSKDLIIGYTFEKGLGEHGKPLYLVLGVMALVTAFLTASYAFRLWFRVFMGPERYEMGADSGHHVEAEQLAAADPHQAPDAAGGHGHGHDAHGHAVPHEPAWWPMNLPLVVLAVGALFGGLLGLGEGYGWIGKMVRDSTAAAPSHGADYHAPSLFGMDLHLAAMIASGIISIAAIALAWYLHAANRAAGDKLGASLSGLSRILYNKYYVDELYHAVITVPSRVIGYVCWVIDEFLIGGLVRAIGFLPSLTGYAIRPAAHGKLQGYGLGMIAGAAAVAVLIIFAVTGGWGN